MRFYLIILLLVACGVHAAGESTSADTATANTENFSDENREEKITAQENLVSPRRLRQLSPAERGDGIPALILPNNVCIINTDLSPGRTIDEHIMACVRAHRLRQSITQ